ncbi:hypothetical protein SRIMM317S_00269 [Streptomyces rimosus subsp. rimosus]
MYGSFPYSLEITGASRPIKKNASTTQPLITPARSRRNLIHINWPGERPTSSPFLLPLIFPVPSGPSPEGSVCTAVWDGLVIAKFPRTEFTWNRKPS